MRIGRVLLGALLLTLTIAAPAPAPVAADDGLHAKVAAAYFPRYSDSELHAIAHERVAELAACQCLSHDGARGGAEVIGYNSGMPDPAGSVVRAWQNSAGHHAILSDTSYGRIGCAELNDGTRHWFACVLAHGPLPPAVAAAPPPPATTNPGPILLPNTALPAP